MTDEEILGRVEKAAWLSDLARRDSDVQLMVVGALQHWGVFSLKALAVEEPDAFDRVVEVVEDLVAQMPTEERPRFLQ